MVVDKSDSVEVKEAFAQLKAVADNDPSNDSIISTPIQAQPLTYQPNKKIIFIIATLIVAFILLILLIFIGAGAFILFTGGSGVSFGQNYVYSGSVVTSDGEPIKNVLVIGPNGEDLNTDYLGYYSFNSSYSGKGLFA